ncbi:MAG: HAD family hydrolase [Cyanobacteria bacterium SIG30]|nr:HAD family hydrolase [Cyanobacteria bacterium SIG30]
MNKAVIFDVDGTLLDGTEGIINSVKYTINEMKLPKISQAELISFIGPPVQNSAKDKFSLSEEEAQKFANIFRKKYADGNVFLANVYDGIYELLHFLKRKNYKLGVATYKREDYAINLMKHFEFDKYFDFICGADNENKLTKFDILVNCKNSLCTRDEKTIMIGDSYHDAQAAKKLNVDFIGVTYGFGFKTEKDINQYPNILCASKVNEILKYFQEQ